MASAIKKMASLPTSLRHTGKFVKTTVSETSENPAGSSTSDDSMDLENAGVRLDGLSLSDSMGLTPPPKRTKRVYEFANNARIGAALGLNFELGKKPSGDVFGTPAKDAQDDRNDNTEASAANDDSLNLAMSANEEILGGSPSHLLRNKSSNISGRHHVGGVDAQGIYPPTACVFVANLPEPKEDQALEAAVTREFSKYGTVFVKIRRDIHHMPFAFCQYTKDEDAKVALEQGKGAIILGRACRTEMVKANRTFIVYNRHGTPITTEEVRELLQPFGALNKCEYLHPELKEQLNLPLSVVVIEFAMFDAGRDLASAFRHHEDYKVEPLDLKRMDLTRRNPDEAYLKQYEIDRRSVFVGGLPSDTDETELRALFEGIGPVLSVQLVKKPSSAGLRVFAFIEFSRADLPEEAIGNFHEATIRDARIRVERKVVKENVHTPRRARSQFLGGYKSPGEISKEAMAPITPVRQMPDSPLKQEMTPQPMGTASSAPQTMGWVYGLQPIPSPMYGYGAAAAYGAQASHGNVSVTPQTTPGSVNPYAYYGGFWPGMSYVQDPATLSYYGYTTPTQMPTARPSHEDLHATPTRINQPEDFPDSPRL